MTKGASEESRTAAAGSTTRNTSTNGFQSRVRVSDASGSAVYKDFTHHDLLYEWCTRSRVSKQLAFDTSTHFTAASAHLAPPLTSGYWLAF